MMPIGSHTFTIHKPSGKKCVFAIGEYVPPYPYEGYTMGVVNMAKFLYDELPGLSRDECKYLIAGQLRHTKERIIEILRWGIE